MLQETKNDSGCVPDRNRLESDFYPIGEMDGQLFSINLNLEPGYLMDDPRYADSVCGCAFDRTAIVSGHPQ